VTVVLLCHLEREGESEQAKQSRREAEEKRAEETTFETGNEEESPATGQRSATERQRQRERERPETQAIHLRISSAAMREEKRSSFDPAL
jgi:hypothetical protein